MKFSGPKFKWIHTSRSQFEKETFSGRKFCVNEFRGHESSVQVNSENFTYPTMGNSAWQFPVIINKINQHNEYQYIHNHVAATFNHPNLCNGDLNSKNLHVANAASIWSMAAIKQLPEILSWNVFLPCNFMNWSSHLICQNDI